MSLRRSNCAVVSLPGSILVMGGSADNDDDDDDNDDDGDNGVGDDDHYETNTTEALSLKMMLFTAGPTMLTGRYGCAALALPQDHSPRRALVVGGCGTCSLPTAEVLTAAG